MRNFFAKKFHELAKTDPRLALVVADISPAGAVEEFRRDFPDRFINTGVAEQVMIGLCAGMALSGMRPFAYTIATFALYRPFEMIRDDLAYQNLPVTVVGIGGGVSYSYLGGTHHAQEDVFIASSIPNMQVIAPCDPLEVQSATEYCVMQNKGPVYLRLGKAGEPTFTDDAVDKFDFGKLRFIRRGSGVCVVSYGPIMSLAVGVCEELIKRGEFPALVSAHTLKPLDRFGIVELLRSYERVIVIEEVSPEGYLGMKMKQIAYEEQLTSKIYSFSLRDEFIHLYGRQDELLAAHGLSVENIISSI
jgi:transketolase